MSRYTFGILSKNWEATTGVRPKDKGRGGNPRAKEQRAARSRFMKQYMGLYEGPGGKKHGGHHQVGVSAKSLKYYAHNQLHVQISALAVRLVQTYQLREAQDILSYAALFARQRLNKRKLKYVPGQGVSPPKFARITEKDIKKAISTKKRTPLPIHSSARSFHQAAGYPKRKFTAKQIAAQQAFAQKMTTHGKYVGRAAAIRAANKSEYRGSIPYDDSKQGYGTLSREEMMGKY